MRSNEEKVGLGMEMVASRKQGGLDQVNSTYR